jgi:hypothetical protein
VPRAEGSMSKCSWLMFGFKRHAIAIVTAMSFLMIALWEKYSAARENVLMITRSNSHMTTGYGAQAYPGNMKNDCELWDKIDTYE